VHQPSDQIRISGPFWLKNGPEIIFPHASQMDQRALVARPAAIAPSGTIISVVPALVVWSCLCLDTCLCIGCRCSAPRKHRGAQVCLPGGALITVP